MPVKNTLKAGGNSSGKPRQAATKTLGSQSAINKSLASKNKGTSASGSMMQKKQTKSSYGKKQSLTSMSAAKKATAKTKSKGTGLGIKRGLKKGIGKKRMAAASAKMRTRTRRIR